MAPMLDTSDGWSRGPVYGYALLGALACISLIVVVVKCACCRRENRRAYKSSLMYGDRDKDILPPPVAFDEDAEDSTLIQSGQPTSSKTLTPETHVSKKWQTSASIITAGSRLPKANSPFTAAKEDVSRTARRAHRRKRKFKHRKRKSDQQPKKPEKSASETRVPSNVKLSTHSDSGILYTAKTVPKKIPECLKPVLHYFDVRNDENQRYQNLLDEKPKEGAPLNGRPAEPLTKIAIQKPTTDAEDHVVVSRRIGDPVQNVEKVKKAEKIEKPSVSCRIDFEGPNSPVSPASPVSKSVRVENE